MLRYHFHLHFTGEETGLEKLNNLLKVAQLVKDSARFTPDLTVEPTLSPSMLLLMISWTTGNTNQAAY